MYWSLPLYGIKIYHEKVGVILGIPGQFNVSQSINIAQYINQLKCKK